jgi:hypothetical protein
MRIHITGADFLHPANDTPFFVLPIFNVRSCVSFGLGQIPPALPQAATSWRVRERVARQ